MLHICHEGENAKRGLNIGWGRMGLRFRFITSITPWRGWYLRFRTRYPFILAFREYAYGPHYGPRR